MKELSEERLNKLHEKHWGEAAPVDEDIAMLQEAYRLGQQEAGVDEQRFQAAKDVMCAIISNEKSLLSILENSQKSPTTMRSTDWASNTIAGFAVKQADTLIAELNRTASDAEKGGENG